MRQKETTATTRFSLLPGSITRFFLLLIIVLLVTMGVMVQSAVNAWLKDKSYQIVDITHAIQKARRYLALRDLADLRQHCRDDLPLLRRRFTRDAPETGCLLSGKTTPQNGSLNLWLSRQLNAWDDSTDVHLSGHIVGRRKCTVVDVLPEWSG